MTTPQRGSLIVVGTGIKLAQHCTPEARDAIVNCDILYAAGGDPITQQWLATLNAAMVSLHDVYRAGRRRDVEYRPVDIQENRDVAQVRGWKRNRVDHGPNSAGAECASQIMAGSKLGQFAADA